MNTVQVLSSKDDSVGRTAILPVTYEDAGASSCHTLVFQIVPLCIVTSCSIEVC